MIQGVSASIQALTAEQRRMDALADDVANVNTNGFKSALSDAEGPIVETGQPLDLAIEGNGRFLVGNGRLTRDGAFQLDASAQIVTPEGEALMPPVQLPAGTDASAVEIGSDGSVRVGGVQVGQIQLVGRGTIRQGALEGSNVDLADNAVGQIEARTSYSAALKALHVQDEMWASLMQVRQ